MRAFGLSVSLALASCSPPDAGNVAAERPVNPGRPTATIETSELGGVFITIDAEETVDGARPRLTLVCDGDGSPGLQIRLVRQPSTPPPLAGVYSSFAFKHGDVERHEMGWMTADGWTFRNDETAESKFVKRFLGATSVEMTPPAAYSAATPVTWLRDTAKPHDQAIRKWCG